MGDQDYTISLNQDNKEEKKTVSSQFLNTDNIIIIHHHNQKKNKNNNNNMEFPIIHDRQNKNIISNTTCKKNYITPPPPPPTTTTTIYNKSIMNNYCTNNIEFLNIYIKKKKEKNNNTNTCNNNNTKNNNIENNNNTNKYNTNTVFRNHYNSSDNDKNCKKNKKNEKDKKNEKENEKDSLSISHISHISHCPSPSLYSSSLYSYRAKLNKCSNNSIISKSTSKSESANNSNKDTCSRSRSSILSRSNKIKMERKIVQRDMKVKNWCLDMNTRNRSRTSTTIPATISRKLYYISGRKSKSFFQERFYSMILLLMFMLITSFTIDRGIVQVQGFLLFPLNPTRNSNFFPYNNNLFCVRNNIRMKNSYILSSKSNRNPMFIYSIKPKKDHHQDFDGLSSHTHIERDNNNNNNANLHLSQDKKDNQAQGQTQNEDSSKSSSPTEKLTTTTEEVCDNDLLNPINKGMHEELKTKIEKKVDFNVKTTTFSRAKNNNNSNNNSNNNNNNNKRISLSSSLKAQPIAVNSSSSRHVRGRSNNRGRPLGTVLTTRPLPKETNILSDDHTHHNVALGHVSTEHLHNIEIQYVAECDMPTELGHFRFRAYKCNPIEKDQEVMKEDEPQREQLLQKLTGLEPVVMMKGRIKKGVNDENVLLRVHDQCLTSEVFGSRRCDCKEQLELALKKVNELEEEKFGCVVYLQQEGRGIGLANKVAAYALQDKGADTVDANRQLGFQDDERTYEVIPQIMEDMGIKSIQLMTNNPFKVKVLKSLGVNITKVVPIIVQPNKDNFQYLFSKANRMEHNLDLDLQNDAAKIQEERKRGDGKKGD